MNISLLKILRMIIYSNNFFLINSSIFKRGDKPRKKDLIKRREKMAEERKAQAAEFKSIIQEMVDELQYMDSTKEKKTVDRKKKKTVHADDDSFSGRAKDIGDFESILQARRKEIMEKLEKDRGSTQPDLETQEIEMEGANSNIDNNYDYPEYHSVEPPIVDHDISEAPKVRPTEEGVIEFDESKYFHERPAPTLISEAKPEIEEEPIGGEIESKVKKGKGKKKKPAKKMAKKARHKKGKPGAVEERIKTIEPEYIEELNKLDELLAMLETIKTRPEKVDMDDIINIMEKLVSDYRSQEPGVKKPGKVKHTVPIEPLEELEPLNLETTQEPGEAIPKENVIENNPDILDRLDELEELEELEEMEELEELQELNEVESVETKPPSKTKKHKKGKKSQTKKHKKKSKIKKPETQEEELEELEELDELEELEELEEVE